MRVLFITKDFNQAHNDGGSVVTKRNYDLLVKLFGEENVDMFSVPFPSKIAKLKGMLFTNDYGITKKIKVEIYSNINFKDYDCVVFNSSLYGNLIKFCAGLKIKTFVFFHNIEQSYYYSMYKAKKNILALLFYKYVKRLEKKSCRYSKGKIVLNQRDADEMCQKYSEKPELILPISMNSPFTSFKIRTKFTNCYGFIGSDFYANREGLFWFIQKVVPYINKDFIVSGTICNWLQDKIKNIKNIKLLGYVDNLQEFYEKVDFIVSPIFNGSGMKTKTVEALSYNLPILGTQEAFVGIDYKEIGGLCENESDFIEKINSFVPEAYQDKPYNYFMANLETSIVQKKFSDFINNY